MKQFMCGLGVQLGAGWRCLATCMEDYAWELGSRLSTRVFSVAMTARMVNVSSHWLYQASKAVGVRGPRRTQWTAMLFTTSRLRCVSSLLPWTKNGISNHVKKKNLSWSWPPPAYPGFQARIPVPPCHEVEIQIVSKFGFFVTRGQVILQLVSTVKKALLTARYPISKQ